MKKVHLLLILCICLATCRVNANGTYWGIHYRLNYQYSTGQGDSLCLKWTFSDGTQLYVDSLYLKGSLDTIQNLYFPGGFLPERLTLEVSEPDNHSLLKSYIVGFAIQANICDGYHNNKALNGSFCDTPGGVKWGTLCASVDLIAVDENLTQFPVRYSGGHFSRPFEIYCEYGTDHKEPALKLTMPCVMGWQQTGADCRWYVSEDFGKTWVYSDTGLEFYPAKGAYKGKLLFGKDIYFRVQVNSLKYHTTSGAQSLAFGRVKFFLGMRSDSTVVQHNSCGQGTNLLFYFQDDTSRKYNTAPAIYLFYKHPDSLQEQRFKLDTFLNVSPISLRGKPFLNQSLGNRRFYLNPAKGTYRLMYDFTPWNGFDCKLQFDTVAIKETGFEFEPVVTVLKHPVCPGIWDGKLLMDKKDKDTAAWEWSRDGLNYKPGPDTVGNLPSGKVTVWCRNKSGCVLKSEVVLKQSGVAFQRIHADTLLCNKQVLQLDIREKSLVSCSWYCNGTYRSNSDSLAISDAGIWLLQRFDSAGCSQRDSMIIRRKDLTVQHDFILPSKASLKDTVMAVVLSAPQPDSILWGIPHGCRSKIVKQWTNRLRFDSAGLYPIKLQAWYEGCGFALQKQIQVLGSADSTQVKKLGYRGPLIQKFEINPNPNDGEHFTIKITLRDTVAVTIFRIDPVSGSVTGDLDLKGKKYYETNAFKTYGTDAVFYLKVMAGNESKTIKVVVIKDN